MGICGKFSKEESKLMKKKKKCFCLSKILLDMNLLKKKK